MSLGRFGGSSLSHVRIQAGESGTAILPGLGNDMLQQARDQLKESPEGAYTVGRVVIGSFTRDLTLANGTQAITGVGFKPYLVLLYASRDGTRELSWGFENGTTRQSIVSQGGAGATGYGPFTGGAVRFDQGASNLNDIASATMDLDGFTVTWSKTGSPTGTGTIHYAAFARG